MKTNHRTAFLSYRKPDFCRKKRFTGWTGFGRAGAAGLVDLSSTKFREIRNRAFESAADVGCADDEKRQLFIAFV